MNDFAKASSVDRDSFLKISPVWIAPVYRVTHVCAHKENVNKFSRRKRK